MEANAPEKIYVDSKAIGDNISTTVRTWPQDYPTCTEYTRTDAFIEKAEVYLKGGLLRYIEFCKRGVGISTEEFIEEFKNYMKGE